MINRTQYLTVPQDGYYIGQIAAIKNGQYDGYVAFNDTLQKYFSYQIPEGNTQKKVVTVLSDYLKAGVKVEMHLSHSPSAEPVETFAYILCS